MTSCWQMLLSRFMTNLEQSGGWIPDAWSVKPKFSLIVTFYLTKTENRSEKSNTALILLLSVKVLFLPKNADFLLKILCIYIFRHYFYIFSVQSWLHHCSFLNFTHFYMGSLFTSSCHFFMVLSQI